MAEPHNRPGNHHHRKGPKAPPPPRWLFLLSILVWSLAVFGMGAWHYKSNHSAFIDNARAAARSSIQKDKIYRHWATGHGGVYVPVTEQTPPNPYLQHVPERDLKTPSGRALTLVNPAYMTRQVHEIAQASFGSKGKITSLDPLRPENSADVWEKEALVAFAAGATEWSTFVLNQEDLYLRMMQPFITKEGCLRCHAHQGYKVGDIRGGISVAIPWAPYQQALTTNFSRLALGYGGIWLAGLGLMGLHRRSLAAFLRLRHDAAQKEKENLRHFQEIFNGVNDAIFLHDLYTGQILDINACAEREYGYTKPELTQLSIGSISADVPPFTADEAAEWMDKARNNENPTFEWRARHKKGHCFWVEVNMRKAHLQTHPVLLATVRNIEERKTNERILAKQQEELHKRNTELERFNHTVSHDLKTPLVTIETFLGFLKVDLRRQDEDAVDRDVSHIRTATRQMAQLLDSLMQLARISHVDHMQQCDFQQLATRALTLVAGPLEERGINVSICAGNIDLFGDQPRLVEIWQNLMENAIKYMGEQTRPLIELGFEQSEAETIFFVRDNGIGICPEYTDKVFDLFEQLDKNAPGNGLGLTLTRQIVEQHQGHIWVESAGNKQGSCFYFSLPTTPVTSEET